MTINLGRAITFAFEDRRWPLKLGLLLLVGLIPGLNLIAWVGYAGSIAHNMARDAREPLPSWDDWADILVRGLLTLVAWFVYLLPIGLITGCILLASWIAGTPGAEAIVRACGALGIAIYGVFATLMLTVGGVQYARTDQYHGYFEFQGRLRDATRRSGLFVVTFVYQALFGLALVILLPPSIVTIGGPLVLITAYSVITGYLIGDAAQRFRLSSEKINRQP